MSHNWGWIEAKYCSGMSLRSIVQLYDLDIGPPPSHSTIRRYAKKHGWTRDADAVKEQLREEETEPHVFQQRVPMSKRQHLLIESHRKDLVEKRATMTLLWKRIAGLLVKRDLSPDTLVKLTSASRSAISAVKDLMLLERLSCRLPNEVEEVPARDPEDFNARAIMAAADYIVNCPEQFDGISDFLVEIGPGLRGAPESYVERYDRKYGDKPFVPHYLKDRKP